MDALGIDAWIVCAITVGALILFVTEVLSVDVVGLLVIVSLVLCDILPAREGLAGFGEPALITIACMFMLAGGLIRCGALTVLSEALHSVSKGSNARLVVALMATVAVSSAFVNNTPIVVIFLPLVLGLAGRTGLAPSQLLIPMSYASILGGTCTLIGTSTNLLVSSVARDHGYPEIGMFEFTAAGVMFALVGFVFLGTVGRFLLPTRATVSQHSGERIREFVTEIMFPANSALLGKSYQEVLGKVPSITPVMLVRGHETFLAPLISNPRTQFIRENDVLLLRGDPGSINAIIERDGITLPPELGEVLQGDEKKGRTLTMVELVVSPNSPLIGRTIAGAGFSRRFGEAVPIAVLRRDEHIRERVTDIRLRLGDTLLVVVDECNLDALRNTEAFIMLEGVDKSLVRRDKAPLAVSIMALVVVFAALNLLPISVLALTGATLMILTGCLPIRMAYASLDLGIIVLIASMLALGRALEETQVIHHVSLGVIGALQGWGPHAVLAGIYVLSAVLTSLASNTAVAVLLTPLAIDVGSTLGYEPAPFLFAVLFGASACFATPMGYQTNLLVYGPGGYRFTDYLRIGVPLTIVLFLTSLFVIPWFWPFHPL